MLDLTIVRWSKIEKKTRFSKVGGYFLLPVDGGTFDVCSFDSVDCWVRAALFATTAGWLLEAREVKEAVDSFGTRLAAGVFVVDVVSSTLPLVIAFVDPTELNITVIIELMSMRPFWPYFGFYQIIKVIYLCYSSSFFV